MLTEYYEWASNTPREGVEECLAFDEVRDHYFWFHLGWDGKRRVQGVMVYLRIRGGKIWVTDPNAIAMQRRILYTASHLVDETPKLFYL
ncbi:element excision factor XisI family protein [Trichocoleus sp. FACHB-40]|uniref:element excision factor XisI family protein n=1 Tax=Trichocoleus sp. FACHB-40 TaxID=2692870 RepID=UPI0032202BE7